MQDQLVVITGGATGIGWALAAALSPANTVVSLDRNPASSAALRASLPAVVSLRADVTDPAQLAAALAAVARDYGRIDLLIHNAGVGGPVDVRAQPEAALMAALKAEIDTNYLAPIRLTKLALPLLEASARPRVLFITSGLAYVPIAAFGGYCASKAAAHFFAMSLRQQLRGSRIEVVEALPPTVATRFNENQPDIPKMAPDVYARKLLRALAAGRPVIRVGQSAVLEKLARLAPGLAFRLLNRG
ncbi:SDR family NAD(P)-dependent oxidoreductase [Hymenobacter sp. CRA2]|uniref:SDR family NAD(P)-dependent oxidoreductase n=1 Tax=Hymenobacter sp. CRA2 TaxID=1955620 RepID=UPI001592736C|nr:SDR family NAD(P)-dependent oxidoreductase [Hymenobacter sp. CRA2]